MRTVLSPNLRPETVINGVKVAEVGTLAPGQTRPLVVVNGIGAGNNNWGRFPEAMGRLCSLIDVSHSNELGALPTMAKYSHKLVNTLDELGHEKVDLLGVSWGGVLAQETAIQHSDRIGKLVLAATLPGWPVPPTETARHAMRSSDRTSDEFLRNAGKTYGGDIHDHPELLELAGITRRPDPEAYKLQIRAIGAWLLQSPIRSSRIRQRTLVMGGEDDPIARAINSRILATVIPRTKLVMIPKEEGGGHLFLYTRPDESAAVINEFLNKKRETK